MHIIYTNYAASNGVRGSFLPLWEGVKKIKRLERSLKCTDGWQLAVIREKRKEKMNQFLNRLERKFGRYSIIGLMKYIVIIDLIGAILGIINPMIYYQYLSLDFGEILHGQVWRLITFIFAPSLTSQSFLNPINVLFFAINVYLYYWIGNSLENAWGSFRFNLYYLSGILLDILASAVIYIAWGQSLASGLGYINQALFLAFAVLYPNVQLLLFFIIPVKVKWLGILYGALLGYNIVRYVALGQFPLALALFVAVANFIIFFLSSRNYRRVSPKEQRRKMQFKREVHAASNHGGSRHKCAICGRTEQDDESLEFRFCSKCDGNYEYCNEHLFTHEHVKKG